jgi:Holliday junction resolvase RusA-like endonuclease
VTDLHRIWIPGTPRPQGSLRFVTRRYAASSPALVAYREQLVAAHCAEWAGRDPISIAVRVDCSFRFARPKAHYGTGRNAETRKDAAPWHHTQTPDVDKLLRAQLDALVVAGVLADDALVTTVAGRKDWVPRQFGRGSGVTVTIREALI